MEHFTLSNGVAIPAVGFGTWKAAETDGVAVLSEAIRAGYRHIDTASFYGTEESVGKAVAQSGVARGELFITTKAWKTEMGYDNILRAFDKSCQMMGLDYVDLYLIHWPLPSPDYTDWRALDRDSWKAVERIYEQGGARAIGVSNFLVHHLENLLSGCNIAPMADQVEFHPGYTQWDTVEFAQKHGIQMEAWSPLGRQRLAQEPLLNQLAEKYGVSLAQLCLKFALQCNVIPLPKSANPERMRQNLALDFTISDEDMGRIHAMPLAGWSGQHPDR